MEILAPVGNDAMLVAAIRAGADAVYLGGQRFNARQKANGFDADGLYEAVRLCHARNVRVYFTVNTIVFEHELSELRAMIQCAADACVDAFIVQDLAAYRIIRDVVGAVAGATNLSTAMTGAVAGATNLSAAVTGAVAGEPNPSTTMTGMVGATGRGADSPPHAPHVPRLHASTQMAVHNVDGLRALKNLGFSRAVLAREMTASEIAIATQSVDIETEIFVHGALCMSISGLCYMSAMIGERSANRGNCAQACRLPYRIQDPNAPSSKNIATVKDSVQKPVCRQAYASNDAMSRNSKYHSRRSTLKESGLKPEYPLSLKDNCLIQHIDQTKELGVTALKIEGRLKRPEYVEIAVREYRNALSGMDCDTEALERIFSRNGFTDAYFTDNFTPDAFGMRSAENAKDTKAFLQSNTNFTSYNKKNLAPIATVRFQISIRRDRPITLCAVDENGHVAEVMGDIPEVAKTQGVTEDSVRRSLEKLGGTEFKLAETDSIHTEIDEGLFVAAAELNALRREAIALLAQKRENGTIR